MGVLDNIIPFLKSAISQNPLTLGSLVFIASSLSVTGSVGIDLYREEMPGGTCYWLYVNFMWVAISVSFLAPSLDLLMVLVKKPKFNENKTKVILSLVTIFIGNVCILITTTFGTVIKFLPKNPPLPRNHTLLIEKIVPLQCEGLSNSALDLIVFISFSVCSVVFTILRATVLISSEPKPDFETLIKFNN